MHLLVSRCCAYPALLERHGKDRNTHFSFKVQVDLSEVHQTEEVASHWELMSLEESVVFLEKMVELPSVESFTCILQKCRKKKDLMYAKRVHTHICKHGLEIQKVLGNYLVPMFVECGSLCDSQQVFHRLIHRNEYSWTSLLHGFMECGESNHAFNLFQEMQEDCVHPSKFTFPVLLNACASLGCKERGLKVHDEIAKEGFEGDLFIGNALVDMYAKWGSLAEARKVLDEMSDRDVVSWTSLITGYTEHGLGVEALSTFEHMRLEGVCPDDVTYVSCLRACGSIGAIERGQGLHAEITEEGFERDPFVGNTLVDMYASCGLLAEAQGVFDELPIQAVVTWTALIAGYAEHGLHHKVLSCLGQMRLKGVHADAVTYICSLKACGSVGAIHTGQEIHAELVIEGFDRGPFVGSTLVDMYAKCGLLADASDVFDELSDRDVVSWTALIAGYAEHGLGKDALNSFKEMQHAGLCPNMVTFICSLKACSSIGATHEGQEIHAEVVKEGFDTDCFIGNTLVDLYTNCGLLVEAREVFDELLTQDVVSLNTMISGFAEQGDSKEALLLYAQMQEQGLFPDSLTFASVLKACGNTQALEMGKRVHSQIYQFGHPETTDMIMSTALLDMYGKCGSMVDAQQAFDALPRRELMQWTALITGYAHQGESEHVSCLFGRMREEGVQPNEITFLSILAACSHAGLVDEGLKYFESMSKDYGITPSTKHCNCMVDLFSRVGRLHDAVGMLDKMPSEPDLATWSTVLGACWKWCNVKLGRKVFESAVRLNGNHAALFTLMSNIYADANMWEDAKKIQGMRVSIQASKTPEKSWIQVGGSTQFFVAGNKRNPQGSSIHVKQKQGRFLDGFLEDALADIIKDDVSCGHSVKLAISCGLVQTHVDTPIRVASSLLVCNDCHMALARVSKAEGRTVICRDARCFHVFKDEKCVCGNYY